MGIGMHAPRWAGHVRPSPMDRQCRSEQPQRDPASTVHLWSTAPKHNAQRGSTRRSPLQLAVLASYRKRSPETSSADADHSGFGLLDIELRRPWVVSRSWGYRYVEATPFASAG